ncbi:hypothetical protein [Microlunatus parietis]|nr:hypothetical protein [Microlunatus parietis]
MVGRHLARMHELRFDHPGYLTDGPPAGRSGPVPGPRSTGLAR